MDLTLRPRDGFIFTDLYAKPTDSHLYLHPSSSHPRHVKKAIPLGVALRMKRNCSTDDFVEKRYSAYKFYLEYQGYNSRIVEKQFQRAIKTDRMQLLKPKTREKKVDPLVLDYNPRLPDGSKVIKKHFTVLSESRELNNMFTSKSIIEAYRRTKNLKEVLAPSRLRPTQQLREVENPFSKPGCFKCKGRCNLCDNFLIESDRFWSLATERSYKIKERVGCTSANVIYLISCTKCNLQHVGSTSTQLKVRFRNHKSAIRTSKSVCGTAIHFNQSPHQLSDFNLIGVERIRDFNPMGQKLLTK